MPRKRSVESIKRSRVMKQRKKALKIANFATEEKAISKRIAHFLYWCSQQNPHQIITYEEITQATLDLPSLPRKSSIDVVSIRRRMSSSYKVLKDKYHCERVTLRGVGARATVDELDVLSHAIPEKSQRADRAIRDLEATVSRVSPERIAALIEELPESERSEILELSEWYKDKLLKAVKTLKRSQGAKALLPPPPPA